MIGKERYLPARHHILCFTYHGKIRGPSGSSVTGIVPTNAYPCLPDSPTGSAPTYIIIGANGDTLYNRLMTAINRTDLIGPSYQHNMHRVARQAEIEEAISAWTSQRSGAEVIEAMNKASIPVGRVVNVQGVVEGEQIQARGAVRDVWVNGSRGKEGWGVKMQGTFPLIDGVDPQPKWAGPDLGKHTEDVLMDDLGYSAEEVEQLRKDGVIG